MHTDNVTGTQQRGQVHHAYPSRRHLLSDVGVMGLESHIPASQTLDHATRGAAHADETNGLATYHARFHLRRAWGIGAQEVCFAGKIEEQGSDEHDGGL